MLVMECNKMKLNLFVEWKQALMQNASGAAWAHLHIAVNFDFVQLRMGVISNINKYIVNVLEYI